MFMVVSMSQINKTSMVWLSFVTTLSAGDILDAIREDISWLCSRALSLLSLIHDVVDDSPLDCRQLKSFNILNRQHGGFHNKTA